jgi:hypothetical protein
VMAVLNVAAEDIWGNDSPRIGRALGQGDRQAFSQMNGNNGWIADLRRDAYSRPGP